MNLRNVVLILAFIVSFFNEINSQNTRLSILRTYSSVTHEWKYMPSDDVVTKDGLKNNIYPLVLSPNKTYLQSEMINVYGCDMELSVRYYVSTKDTHPIKIELLDKNDNIVHSYINKNPELNDAYMTIADVDSIGIIPGIDCIKVRLSLSDAYNSTEIINVDELELYSKNGAPQEGGVENIETQTFSIVTEPNQLVINSDMPTIMQIYSLSGMLVKENAICPGTNRISISSGFYLLNIDGEVCKIIVP